MVAIEKVQKKFVRNITYLTGIYVEKLAKIKMLTLKNRRKYLDMVETFKIINGGSRVDYRDFFNLVGDNQRRNTRSNDCPMNIIVGRCNLEIRRNFFPARVAHLWNGLPTDFKMCGSIRLFKSNLKLYLIELNSDPEERDF